MPEQDGIAARFSIVIFRLCCGIAILLVLSSFAGCVDTVQHTSTFVRYDPSAPKYLLDAFHRDIGWWMMVPNLGAGFVFLFGATCRYILVGKFL
jgi:hypothetical protein